MQHPNETREARENEPNPRMKWAAASNTFQLFCHLVWEH